MDTFLKELKFLAKHLFYWVVFFVLSFLFFLLLGPKKEIILGKSVIIPVFTGNTFTVNFFKLIEHSFVPAGVQLIVTNPWSGFVAQFEIALTMAFILVFPLFLYTVIKYISPALHDVEKKGVFTAVAVSTFLFILGCAFAFFYMIPLTFKFMYPFATALGITTFFTLEAFMAWVVSILIATGITFLLPVFMYILCYFGIVKPDFWKRKWRHAFVILLIFCAVITPDQTGITMVLLFIPLVILYAVGAFFSGRL